MRFSSERVTYFSKSSSISGLVWMVTLPSLFMTLAAKFMVESGITVACLLVKPEKGEGVLCKLSCWAIALNDAKAMDKNDIKKLRTTVQRYSDIIYNDNIHA